MKHQNLKETRAAVLWLSSQTRAKLDATGRGIYRELLDFCLSDGSFSKDRTVIARLCNCTPEQLDATWPLIKTHFRSNPNDSTSWINPPALMKRKAIDEFLNHQSLAGKSSADKRNKKKLSQSLNEG